MIPMFNTFKNFSQVFIDIISWAITAEKCTNLYKSQIYSGQIFWMGLGGHSLFFFLFKETRPPTTLQVEFWKKEMWMETAPKTLKVMREY